MSLPPQQTQAQSQEEEQEEGGRRRKGGVGWGWARNGSTGGPLELPKHILKMQQIGDPFPGIT